jgi:hypothetical protein
MYTLSSVQRVEDLRLQLVEALASFEGAYARWVEAPLQNTDLTYG